MNAYAIIDLQFGSTGKGLLAGYLARRREPDTVVCAFGPNAGHTFVWGNGEKLVHTMIPIGAISPRIRTVLIGPGAVIDPDAMKKEADHLRALGHNFQLAIHQNAAVVTEEHRERERASNGTLSTGSTMKGTGAALVDKIMRVPGSIAMEALRGNWLWHNVVTVRDYNALMDKAELLQIEGAQGFSLSHHHGFYPFVTSRDCTVLQLLSDCAVPMLTRRGTSWRQTKIEVLGVARTYPIRVNNRGGDSGPGYPDQMEIKWADIGVKPELTTVTRLERRVFTFSAEQIKQAIRMNAVDGVFLNFCNYIGNSVIIGDLCDTIEDAGSRVLWTGWGPSENDIKEV